MGEPKRISYEMFVEASIANLQNPLLQDKGMPRMDADEGMTFLHQLRGKILDCAQNLSDRMESGLETAASVEDFKSQCQRLLANVRQYHAIAMSKEVAGQAERPQTPTRGGLRDGSPAIQRWLLNPCERCLTLVPQLLEGKSGVRQQLDFWLQELKAGCGILEVQNPLATPDADDEAEDATGPVNARSQEALLSLRYDSQDICIKGTFITVVSKEAEGGRRRAQSHPPRLCLSRGGVSPSPPRQRALSMHASIVDMGGVPPPPQPHADQAQRRLPARLPARHDASAASAQRQSLGTRGHPHTCGTPCRYVRKKTGCRDGADCPNCHECLWQRKSAADPWQTPPASAALADASPLSRLRKAPEPLQPGAVNCPPQAALSTDNLDQTAMEGSQGHPLSCGPPCRYVRRKSGCRDGAKCPNCHLCLWQRGTRRKRDATASFLLSTTASGSGNESADSDGWQGSPSSMALKAHGAPRSAGAVSTPKGVQRGLPLVFIDQVKHNMGVQYHND